MTTDRATTIMTRHVARSSIDASRRALVCALLYFIMLHVIVYDRSTLSYDANQSIIVGRLRSMDY